MAADALRVALAAVVPVRRPDGRVADARLAGAEAVLTDCYEKGHIPYEHVRSVVCMKCDAPLFLTDAGVYHTQAELDRLWQGVDREATRVMGEECGCGHDPMLPSGAHHSGCEGLR